MCHKRRPERRISGQDIRQITGERSVQSENQIRDTVNQLWKLSPVSQNIKPLGACVIVSGQVTELGYDFIQTHNLVVAASLFQLNFLYQLAGMYDISMQRIYAILHSSGEYESQKYNHIETALKKEKKMRNQTFLDAYKKNPQKSIIELSREVNISPSLGYLILHQNGIYQYNVKARAKENSENAD